MPSLRYQHYAEPPAKWKQIDQLFDRRFYYVFGGDRAGLRELCALGKEN
jgi:hypothetical protein